MFIKYEGHCELNDYKYRYAHVIWNEEDAREEALAEALMKLISSEHPEWEILGFDGVFSIVVSDYDDFEYFKEYYKDAKRRARLSLNRKNPPQA